MQYEAAGDPIAGTKWTRTTPQKIADILTSRGFTISRNTVASILREMGFSLKANRKMIATTSSPDRNQQFGIIKAQRDAFQANGQPVISVDTNYARVRIMHGLRTGGRPALDSAGALQHKMADDDLRSTGFYFA